MPNNLKRIPQKKRKEKSSPHPRPTKELKSKSNVSAIQVRHLKVSSQAVPRENSFNGIRNIPFLRLTGVWLENAGFPVDSKVDIIVGNNLLVIKPTVI